jgi:hypothetical protein
MTTKHLSDMEGWLSSAGERASRRQFLAGVGVAGVSLAGFAIADPVAAPVMTALVPGLSGEADQGIPVADAKPVEAAFKTGGQTAERALHRFVRALAANRRTGSPARRRQLIDDPQDVGKSNGFPKNRVHVSLRLVVPRCGVAPTRKQHDGEARSAGFDLAREFPSIHVGHSEVREREVQGFAGEESKSRWSIGCLQHGMPRGSQEGRDRRQDHWLVVHNQQPAPGGGDRRRGWDVGGRIRTLES